MPSFVYSTVTIEQLDDVDAYTPSILPIGPQRPAQCTLAQLNGRLSQKSTLVELIKQQQQPANRSSLTLNVPAHEETVNAGALPRRSWRQKLRWSPSSSLSRDSLALSFFVGLLLFCCLCVDQFALTQVALDTSSSQPGIVNVSNAPITNALGAFTFCRAGSWTSSTAEGANVYTFVPDHHCSRIGGTCEADGWSLSLMLGRSDTVSCGLFDVFRAYLLIAFFCSAGAVGLGALYLRQPSPAFGVAVVIVMLAVTVTTLVAGCVVHSILPSSATHSHSFWLLIAALLLSLPCSVLFVHSEHTRLYPRTASSSDAIHSDVPPVRLTESDDAGDESWERRRHEVSQSMYTLDDDDHGALLAIQEAAQQPSAATDHKEQHPTVTATAGSSLWARRRTVASIASKAGPDGERVEALEGATQDGEAEVSVGRIDMQQAQWDEEADEARMEDAGTSRAATSQRTEGRVEADESEEKIQRRSK